MSEKEHTNYPSKYEVGEEVQLNFGKLGIIKPVKIQSVIFTESKVYYDVEFEYDSGVIGSLSDIDSVFVEDLNQQKPNCFCKKSDLIEYLDKSTISEGELLDRTKDQVDLLNNCLNKEIDPEVKKITKLEGSFNKPNSDVIGLEPRVVKELTQEKSVDLTSFHNFIKSIGFPLFKGWESHLDKFEKPLILSGAIGIGKTSLFSLDIMYNVLMELEDQPFNDVYFIVLENILNISSSSKNVFYELIKHYIPDVEFKVKNYTMGSTTITFTNTRTRKSVVVDFLNLDNVISLSHESYIGKSIKKLYYNNDNSRNAKSISLDNLVHRMKSRYGKSQFLAICMPHQINEIKEMYSLCMSKISDQSIKVLSPSCYDIKQISMDDHFKVCIDLTGMLDPFILNSKNYSSYVPNKHQLIKIPSVYFQQYNADMYNSLRYLSGIHIGKNMSNVKKSTPIQKNKDSVESIEDVFQEVGKMVSETFEFISGAFDDLFK